MNFPRIPNFSELLQQLWESSYKVTLCLVKGVMLHPGLRLHKAEFGALNGKFSYNLELKTPNSAKI